VSPKLTVLSHTSGSPELLAKIKKSYSGRLEMGDDLMVIEIGETVTVKRK
jgi:hypothetical protein